jgi:hypothetical protein
MVAYRRRAVVRSAVQTSLSLVSFEKHAAQHPEKLRKKPSLNYKSAALNQLSYADAASYESRFSEFIRSSAAVDSVGFAEILRSFK